MHPEYVRAFRQGFQMHGFSPSGVSPCETLVRHADEQRPSISLEFLKTGENPDIPPGILVESEAGVQYPVQTVETVLSEICERVALPAHRYVAQAQVSHGIKHPGVILPRRNVIDYERADDAVCSPDYLGTRRVYRYLLAGAECEQKRLQPPPFLLQRHVRCAGTGGHRTYVHNVGIGIQYGKVVSAGLVERVRRQVDDAHNLRHGCKDSEK